MAYIIWIVLIGLITWSHYDPKIPKWVPLVVYLIVVIVRAIEKHCNNSDWKKINERDEKLKLKEMAKDFASRGLTFSGIRNQAEEKVKEDFKSERKQKRRTFLIEILDTLFLK